MNFNNSSVLFKSLEDLTLNNIVERFNVIVDDIKYQVYLPNFDIKAKKLYVSLSGGARLNSDVKFDRWSWRSDLQGNLICIEDPMYEMFPNIFIGWYFGTKQKSFLDPIVKIISKICQLADFEKLVFLGSSASGFAISYLASFFKRSMVLALNPQFDISLWKPWTVSRFEKETSIKLTDNLASRFNIVSRIQADELNKYFFYFNLKSEWDRRQAMLLTDLPSNIDVPTIIQRDNKTFFFSSIDWPDPHTTYLDRFDLQIIERCLNSFDSYFSRNLLNYILIKNQNFYNSQFEKYIYKIFLQISSRVKLDESLHFAFFEKKIFFQIRYNALDPKIHFELKVLDFKHPKFQFAFHVEIKDYLNPEQEENIRTNFKKYLPSTINVKHKDCEIIFNDEKSLLDFMGNNFSNLAKSIFEILK